MHASQLFAWRKAARDGRLIESGGVDFAPVIIASDPSVSVALPAQDVRSAGHMEIVLGNGRRVIVDASVKAAALARVIRVLDRR